MRQTWFDILYICPSSHWDYSLMTSVNATGLMNDVMSLCITENNSRNYISRIQGPSKSHNSDRKRLSD